MLVHIVTDHFNVGGGIEHIFQVVQGLPQHDFKIFAKPGNALEKFSGLPNVETCPIGFAPELVLRPKPDLVHIHHLLPLLAFFRNPLARYDIPIIYTAHGLHIHKYEFAGGAWNSLKYKMRWALEKYLFAKADRIIAVSKADLQFLRTRYRSRQAECIPNGIDHSRLEEVRQRTSEIRNEFQLPAAGVLFLTVARFDFQKGYDILIQAIALSKDFLRQKKARFLLAGDGATLAEMKKMSERLQLGGLVCFLGNRSDAYSLMKSSDLMVLPSRWEGLPIALLEAGLLRLPVIASDTYGNHELLAGDKGILFANENAADLAKKIAGAILGEYDLDRLAGNLYHAIKKDYGLDNMLAGLQRTYSSIVGRKNGNRKN